MRALSHQEMDQVAGGWFSLSWRKTSCKPKATYTCKPKTTYHCQPKPKCEPKPVCTPKPPVELPTE